MELTEKQKKGLDIALKRYRNKEKYTLIEGYAGTGKSVLIKFIAEALGNEPGIDPAVDIGYACYCGKAVQVLIDKGNENAVTLHKLLYTAVPLADGTFLFKPKTSLEYKIIIVDEISMVPQQFIDLLLSHDVYVIFCGDPGQLGAIKGEANNLLPHPHIFLDEIMRQAKESGIIELSMLIREGRDFNNFKTKDAMVLPRKELNTGMLTWADQIICATNATRKSLNSQVRELKGYTKPIEEGESLICLTNEWETLSNRGNALTNGVIGKLTNVFSTYQLFPQYMNIKDNRVPLISGVFISNTGDNYGNIYMDKQCVLTGDPYLTGKQKFLIKKSKKYSSSLPFEFTYSYAATCWKFQGSSAEKILGIEESFPWSKEEHMKYLYTLVTRAEEKCVLISKD